MTGAISEFLFANYSCKSLILKPYGGIARFEIVFLFFFFCFIDVCFWSIVNLFFEIYKECQPK